MRSVRSRALISGLFAIPFSNPINTSSVLTRRQGVIRTIKRTLSALSNHCAVMPARSMALALRYANLRNWGQLQVIRILTVTLYASRPIIRIWPLDAASSKFTPKEKPMLSSNTELSLYIADQEFRASVLSAGFIRNCICYESALYTIASGYTAA